MEPEVQIAIVSQAWAEKAVARFWERLRAGESAKAILECDDPFYVGKIVLGHMNLSMTYEMCSRILEWEKEDA